jgi:hypothetical protein
MAIDLSQSWGAAKSRTKAIVAFTKASAGAKELKASAGNSESPSNNALNTQLDKIQNQQKRYLRNPPTSFTQMLELIGLVSGSGGSTISYLRRKLIETSVAIEPEVRKIISDEAIHAIGCSQEQTFNGYSVSNLNLNPLSTLPEGEGIYVPVESLDIGNLLKNAPDSTLGKSLYEAPEVTTQAGFLRPYGGKIAFPMNKQLNQRMDSSNLGRSYYTEFGKYYQGTSGQPLFDFEYSKTNQYGITQDCYRFALIDKEPITGDNEQSGNNVGDFLNDYYSTIKIIDSVDMTAAIMNLLSGAISMKANISADEITENSKFYLLLQRILGLCFDSRKEIDVSGISKIAELDGVDESFFEFTEVDLRNIDVEVTNIQNKVVEFEDCNNIKLPVDYENIVAQLVEFRSTLSGQTTEHQVNTITSIIDSLYQNPDWKLFIPTNLNVEVAINKNVLKQIPIAVASAILSPKVLLPIFVLLKVVESNALSQYNQLITSGNTFIQSGNNSLGGVNNIVNNSVDFLRVFKTFSIQVVSKIGAIYLKTLYKILEKDIINLIYFVNQDIIKSKILKKYQIISALLQILNYYLIISQLVDDYRRCKSLVNDILILLNLISQSSGLTSNDIPAPLLALSGFLPGTDPNRSTINTIEFLQELGLPTNALPDGSPNLMVLYNLATHKGADKENSENGKVQATIDANCAFNPAACTRIVGKAT